MKNRRITLWKRGIECKVFEIMADGAISVRMVGSDGKIIRKYLGQRVGGQRNE